MAEVKVLSSPLFDRIAGILANTQWDTMAPASLYCWFAKGFSYDVAELAAFADRLRTYAETGEAPGTLAQKGQDFPDTLPEAHRTC